MGETLLGGLPQESAAWLSAGRGREREQTTEGAAQRAWAALARHIAQAGAWHMGTQYSCGCVQMSYSIRTRTRARVQRRSNAQRSSRAASAVGGGDEARARSCCARARTCSHHPPTVRAVWSKPNSIEYCGDLGKDLLFDDRPTARHTHTHRSGAVTHAPKPDAGTRTSAKPKRRDARSGAHVPPVSAHGRDRGQSPAEHVGFTDPGARP